MSQVIALHWSSHALHAVVLGQHLTRTELAAVLTIPVEADSSAADMGQQLAKLLAKHTSGRTQVVVAVGRSHLNWQHQSLPPSPAEDLPDLVRLQASQDAITNGSNVGFDFLPLSGDDHLPHRVWTVSLAPAEFTKINKICAAANLKPDHIVPLSLGYPAWVSQDHASHAEALTISVAPDAEEATLWATLGEKMVLFRQLQLPASGDWTARASAIAGEIRRTKLALSQQEKVNDTPHIQLVTSQRQEHAQLAQALSTALGEEIQLFLPSKGISLAEDEAPVVLPLAGLAVRAAQAAAPPLDLLHPRQRPAPQSRHTTYTILAAGVAGLLTLVGWSGYAALNSPLRAAEAAELELSALEESLPDYANAEQQAKTIRNWQANSANLLSTIDVLSGTLRPEALTAESFSADKDTVLERFDLIGKRLTIQGVVRSSSSVPPLEVELRKTATRVHREQSAPGEGVPGYPWRYKFVIDVANKVANKQSPAELATP